MVTSKLNPENPHPKMSEEEAIMIAMKLQNLMEWASFTLRKRSMGSRTISSNVVSGKAFCISRQLHVQYINAMQDQRNSSRRLG